MTDRDWEGVRRLLCIRLDSLGDVLMTGPAIRALSEAAPGRRLTLLTSPAGAAAAALLPGVDDVLVYEAPWMKATPHREDPAHDEQFIATLREGEFDAAVIFTVFSQNPLPAALLCYLAGIPLRLAYCHENPYQLLTHWVPDPDPVDGIRHEVRRQLELVAAIGARTLDERLAVTVPSEEGERIVAYLEARGVDLDRPWVVVHPGASAESRRYPCELYAKAVRALVGEHGVQVVLTGSTAEGPLVDAIAGMAGIPVVRMVGDLGLPGLAALLRAAPVVITNNTGPAHLAAAVGTPVAVLYALTNPQHTPWGVPSRVLSHDVPCRNCFKSRCPMGHHDCLRLVPPEAVVTAAVELLGR
jgi:lipopolysaccharide heptosyltransferase II